jgi:hypothetical protein
MVRAKTETAVLITLTAVLYWLGYEFQGWLFQFTEHVPGVNWFYLPAGLRVVFILVAGLNGALGIFAATIAINLMHTEDMSLAVLLLTAVASGFGAWFALMLMRWRGQIDASLMVLTSAVLIQYALIYALFNAVLHQVVWWALQRDGARFMVDVWPMFVGDLLGALFFLYALKGLIKLKSQ